MYLQLFPNYLLRKLSFLHWIIFAHFSMNYLCGSISGHILFHKFIFLYCHQYHTILITVDVEWILSWVLWALQNFVFDKSVLTILTVSTYSLKWTVYIYKKILLWFNWDFIQCINSPEKNWHQKYSHEPYKDFVANERLYIHLSFYNILMVLSFL